MKPIVLRGIIVLALLSGGCTAGRYSAVTTDPLTGREKTVVYSDVFQASEPLIPGVLDVQVQIQFESWGFSKDPARSEKEDHWTKGELRAYFYNTTPRNVSLRVESITYLTNGHHQTVADDGAEAIIRPGSVARIVGEDQKLARFVKDVRVAIVYVYNGQRKVKEMTVPRLTVEERKATGDSFWDF